MNELAAAVGAGQVIDDEISDKYLKDWSGAAADGVFGIIARAV